MGRKGVAHNAAEVGGSEGFQEGNEEQGGQGQGGQGQGGQGTTTTTTTGQGGGARKTRKGGRRKRRGGRKSRKGGRKSRKIRGGECPEGEDCGFTVGGRRKKRKTKKKRKGKKRKLNPFFKLMLAAKKAGKASFKYGTKLYKGKKHPRLGMIYKKA